MNVFIYYGNKDGDPVRVFASKLEMLGYSVWYDSELSDKKEAHIQILERIRNCDAFVVLITQHMSQEAIFGKPQDPSTDTKLDYTQILYALDLGKPVIPVLFEESDLKWFPDFLKPLMPIHSYKPDVQDSDALTQALSTPPQILSSGQYLSPTDQSRLKHSLKTYLNNAHGTKNGNLATQINSIGSDLAASEDQIHNKYIKQLLDERPPEEAALTCQPEQLSERSFTCHTVVTSVAFSPDGCYVFARTGDGMVRMWNAITGQEILQQFIYPYPAFTFYNDSEWFYLTPWGFDVVEVNSLSGRVGIKYVGHDHFTTSAAYSPDNKLVATASLDGTVRLWEAKGKTIRQFGGHAEGVLSVVFSPDGKYLLTGSRDMTARIWNVETGREIKEFIGHNGHVSSAAFSPDGRFILTGSFDHTVRISASGIA